MYFLERKIVQENEISDFSWLGDNVRNLLIYDILWEYSLLLIGLNPERDFRYSTNAWAIVQICQLIFVSHNFLS